FHVKLFDATNAVIITSVGAGVIFDDDASPILSLTGASVPEGNGGSTNQAAFTARLSAISGQTVSVHYATSNGTAQAGIDYVAVSGDLIFAPGVTNQIITVPMLGDDLSEPNETFFVNLSSPVNATLANSQAVGTILDDDAGRLDHFSFSPVSSPQ